jgi:hypothetical protein
MIFQTTGSWGSLWTTPTPALKGAPSDEEGEESPKKSPSNFRVVGPKGVICQMCLKRDDLFQKKAFLNLEDKHHSLFSDKSMWVLDGMEV